METREEDRTREVLGPPGDLAGPMGVAGRRTGPPDKGGERSPRLPLDELVRRERWDG